MRIMGLVILGTVVAAAALLGPRAGPEQPAPSFSVQWNVDSWCYDTCVMGEPYRQR